MKLTRTRIFAMMAGSVLGLLLPGLAAAHCDALDGPVVADARAAIAAKNVTRVLKWVAASDEAEVRAAFSRTLAVRGLSAEAKELADRSFFETVVRVHRAKEGEPYTGLKPAGTDPGPAVRAVDRALAEGSAEALAAFVADRASESVTKKFARVLELRRHADENVEAGRAFTKAYAEFAHFVEELHGAAGDAGADHDAAAPAHHH